MSRWTKGEATIERLLARGELEQVTGAHADGQQWIDRSRRTLSSAHKLAQADPDSAYVLAYDAARFACTALLIHRGLCPTTTGGHYAIDVAAREQFGGPFQQFGGIRRQRNELEYPTFASENLSPGDADAAVTLAQRIDRHRGTGAPTSMCAREAARRFRNHWDRASSRRRHQ